ncbi:MAG TPA: beta-N-acetylhexosaminidase [Polyangiaceae bacterium]
MHPRFPLISPLILALFACSSPASGDGRGTPVTTGGSAGTSAQGGSSAGGGSASIAGTGGSAGSSTGTGGVAPIVCAPFTDPGATAPTSGLGNVVPLPVMSTLASGAFALAASTGIYVEPNTPEMLAIGQYLADKLKPATGYALPVAATTAAPCSGNIYLTTTNADSTLNAEGYALAIDPKLVRVSAPQPAGVFRGIQTVRQLLPASIESTTEQAGPWAIAAGTIRDFPRFSWRGVMLDVARHFFGVPDVEKFIDVASFYKINTLHLHLSDDQGFRIAINSWPNLTTVGGSTEVDGGPGGFYTQADYSALVAFAKARYITIVPEIDMPGHTNAALASYANLNCNGQAPALRTDTAVGYSSLCVSSDTTYQFASDVTREIAALTPGAYLHLGGDEAKATSLDDFKTFFGKAAPLVQTAGKSLIGWDALGQLDSLPANAIVQYWTTADSARAAVAQHAKVLMSPANKAYMDMKYDMQTPFGQTWAGYITEQTGYEWDPATIVDGVGESDLVGLEAPLWTETLVKLADLEYMAYPRLAGYAEIGWSVADGRSWDEYKTRLATHGPRLRAWNVNFYQSDAIPWQ